MDFIFLYLTGCSSAPQSSPTALTPQYPFADGNKIPFGQSATFTFKIPQGQPLRLELLTKALASSHNRFSVGRISFSDANCTIGHPGAISFQEKNGTYKMNNFEAKNIVYRTKYFAKEIAWNDTHTLHLEWITESKVLRITLDNEIVDINNFPRFYFIGVTTNTPFEFIHLLQNQL